MLCALTLFILLASLMLSAIMLCPIDCCNDAMSAHLAIPESACSLYFFAVPSSQFDFSFSG